MRNFTGDCSTFFNGARSSRWTGNAGKRKNGIEFLIGGGYAFGRYIGLQRDTKDFDLMVRPSAVAATALRWNGGEFLNIFPGKTPLRTFVYANILVEVWAIPALGIRAPFLRGARCHVGFVETRGGAKRRCISSKT